MRLAYAQIATAWKGVVATTVGALIATVCLDVALAKSVPFWGAHEAKPIDTPLSQLRPGEFTWAGEAITSGPTVVVVSLSEQRAYVYRNGLLIGVTTVSTGRKGHETPTGIFTILQKDKDHHSSIYNNAPMPYTERLTWSGVALHAGGLPGYPTSHGCVHLPSEFAKLLFEASTLGMTVVIADDASAPHEVAHPRAFAPVSASTGEPMGVPPALLENEEYRWNPAASPAGPLTVLVSSADSTVFVYRNGVEIGRSRAQLREIARLGTHAYVRIEGVSSEHSRLVPDLPAYRWIEIGIAGHEDGAGTALDPAAADHLEIPQEFVQALYPVMVPGTTLVVTDKPILPSTTGEKLDVINADPPVE